MGGKTTDRTESLSLHMQKMNSHFSPTDWAEIDCYKDHAAESLAELRKTFSSYMELVVGKLPEGPELMEYLEFADADFHDAFTVPDAGDGTQRVGEGGRDITEDYLLKRWLTGQDAGGLRDTENVCHASLQENLNSLNVTRVVHTRHTVYNMLRYNLLWHKPHNEVLMYYSYGQHIQVLF